MSSESRRSDRIVFERIADALERIAESMESDREALDRVADGLENVTDQSGLGLDLSGRKP